MVSFANSKYGPLIWTLTTLTGFFLVWMFEVWALILAGMVYSGYTKIPDKGHILSVRRPQGLSRMQGLDVSI